MRAVEKRLRERIKNLEDELAKVKADREKFRNHFAQRFRWWIKLIGEKRTPNMSWLIESDAKVLSEFERWYW